ncbi:hypothetical protein JCM33374_g4297 [Metschnikowia sp. JCM 33374]|nr:hypothetical protein JCM33374_g4297 [Metschnikowia sp. JCM 33374]
MGLTSFFKRGPSVPEQIKSAGFEISECSEECESCTSSFPRSLSFKEDDDSPLFGSTSPYGLHVVVPTNKTDWAHNATGESKTLAHTVDKWAGDSKFPGLGESTKIKVTVSSLSSLKFETDSEYMDLKRGDLLLLPFFVWVKNVTLENAAGVLNRVVPDLISYRDQELAEFPQTSYSEYPDVEIKADSNKAYVFLCSHRTRDKKCGITAPIMKREMDMHLRDLGLYRDFSDDRPGGVQVAFVNHIGGHKYAANVIIYLKSSGKNIWLARCKPSNVVPIIDECIVEDGKVWPDKVRQVQKFKAIEW